MQKTMYQIFNEELDKIKDSQSFLYLSSYLINVEIWEDKSTIVLYIQRRYNEDVTDEGPQIVEIKYLRKRNPFAPYQYYVDYVLNFNDLEVEGFDFDAINKIKKFFKKAINKALLWNRKKLL